MSGKHKAPRTCRGEVFLISFLLLHQELCYLSFFILWPPYLLLSSWNCCSKFDYLGEGRQAVVGRRRYHFPSNAEKSFPLTNAFWENLFSMEEDLAWVIFHIILCISYNLIIFLPIFWEWLQGGHRHVLLNSLYCKALKINKQKHCSRVLLEILQIIIGKAVGSTAKLREAPSMGQNLMLD